MKIAVIGAGGVGGYLAGRLAEAGAYVVLVSRGHVLAAMKKSGGIRIIDRRGNRLVRGITAVDDESLTETVDSILVCVKSWQVEQVAPKIKPLIGIGTSIITTQNGVEAGETLAGFYGRAQILPAAWMVIAAQSCPGVYEQTGQFMEVTIGHLDGSATTDHDNAILQMLRDIGFSVRYTQDIMHALWRKLLFSASIGGIAAMSNIPVGDAAASEDVDALIQAGMWEVAEVARAQQIPISDDDVRAMIHEYKKFPPGVTTSLHRDIANMRPSELQEQSGVIVLRGKQFGVPTPIHQTVLARLNPVSAALPRGTRGRMRES